MNINPIRVNEARDAGAKRMIAMPVKNITRTATSVADASKPAQRPRRFLAGVGLLLLVLAVAYGGRRWWSYTHTWVRTDNAYITSHIHTVSTRIAGNVTEVLVSENQTVTAGEVLARLDANDLKVQQEKARATLAQTEAQLEQAVAQVTRDEAIAHKTQLDFERADRLIHEANSAISTSEFDNAKATTEAARGSLGAAKAGVRGAEAQVKVAMAQLKEVELQLSYTEITAPATGSVGRKSLEVGNRVQPGQPLFAIVRPNVWVTANFKETQLDRVRYGQTVKLSVDGFPGREFAGRVESIAPTSGAQFALLPPDNATGNFTKIVQRVAVKIVFDDESVRAFAGRVIPGLSVVVKVNVRS